MVQYIIIILLCLIISSIQKDINFPSWNELHGSIESIDIYRNSIAPINHLAVFLLGTLKNPWFGRIKAAKMTWAYHLKHFYTTTGFSPENDEILKDNNYCKNLTINYMNNINNLRKDQNIQVYNCDGINVVHFPYCDGRTVGVLLGSCCRCQGAIDFFHKVLHSHNNPIHHHIPNWFIYSDDDYYMRLHLLDNIVNLIHTSYENEPLSLQPWGRRLDFGDDETYGFVLKIKAGKKNLIIPGYGAEHTHCSVPCVHRMLWTGWAGFNIAAIKLMSSSEGKSDLDSVCTRFLSVPHDVGLGIYTWMFGLKAIKIPHGFDPTWNSSELYDPTLSIKKWNGVIFHKPMKMYDEFFNDIYIEANNGKNEKFNIEILLNYEALIAKELIQNSIPYKMSGIHNSLFYKRKVVRDELITQITNSTLLKSISLTDYSPDNCKEDTKIFNYWRNNIYDTNNNNNNKNTHVPKMCLEYQKYISKLVIPIDDITADFPMNDDQLV